MAKKSSSFTTKMCFKSLAIILGVVAIVMGFLAGASYSGKLAGVTFTYNWQLFGMMFGKWNNMDGTVSDGPLALAGLISFILLVLGIVALVLSFFAKKQEKNLIIIGALLFILAAIFMFLLLAFGVDYKSGYVTTKFSSVIDGYALGAGAWLWAILALLGAGVAG